VVYALLPPKLVPGQNFLVAVLIKLRVSAGRSASRVVSGALLEIKGSSPNGGQSDYKFLVSTLSLGACLLLRHYFQNGPLEHVPPLL